ncbi:MAG: CoA transferase [Phyllobacteriaceae bacterium]|nr:CoA transferase [Phyllobacteriaceae bacterium]
MSGSGAKSGPLCGLAVIEMAGLGPAPFAGLMLAEMGARVLRVERLGAARDFLATPPRFDLDRHGRDCIRLDLKRPEGVALLRRLAETADVLIEGFRPGVMERFGLGPDDLAAINPRLVYGRMTGYGQTGPLSSRAGHDLTYLALTGALAAIGPKDGRPVPPLNLVADYGGGAMFLLTGILAALVERGLSGRGQVIDAAMVDGASMLAAPFFGFLATGFWTEKRGANLLDSGAPFYDTYETADGRHVAVACLEPRFFAEFARMLPLAEPFASRQYDAKLWAAMRAAIAARIGERTRDDWDALFAGTDACVAPVLTFTEAGDHPHNRARHTHVKIGDLSRPAPAPRFSRTPAEVAGPTMRDGTAEALARLGLDEAEIAALRAKGVIGE